MKKDNRSILEEIFETSHMYEFLGRETSDPRLEELIRHFEGLLPEHEFLLLDEMLSRQSMQVASQYSKCFAIGARAGYRLADDLEKDEFEDILKNL